MGPNSLVVNSWILLDASFKWRVNLSLVGIPIVVSYWVYTPILILLKKGVDVNLIKSFWIVVVLTI